jgi:NAD(P)-dependent dehydrogenase (short-subunit alcohol dehydrogenase family)
MANDLDGKVILVTGATEGIGKAAALEFARRGAALTLVGRSREKTERVLAELKAASGNDRIEALLGDLASMADVRAIARKFKETHDRLDVLVNNAGATFDEYRTTPDGLEQTFALNHLAYFQLTVELLELLRRTPHARVVSTSSGAHAMGRIDLPDIAVRANGKAGFRAYGDSKLANILFTRELARKLAGSTATANCFHPGFVATGFAQNTKGFVKGAFSLGQRLFARTPEKGAETLVWLATSPEAAGYTGQYFHDRKVSWTSRPAKDDALAARLWALSEELVAKTQARADGK